MLTALPRHFFDMQRHIPRTSANLQEENLQAGSCLHNLFQLPYESLKTSLSYMDCGKATMAVEEREDGICPH